jgi:4-hydroxy-tetrahydrodipicolinate synthase
VALVREVTLLAGDDVFAPALLAMGAAGGILASAHLATDRWVRLGQAYEPGLGHELAGVAAALFAEPNPVLIKAVLYAQGRIPSAAVRLPLLAAGRPALETALRALGVPGDTRDRRDVTIGETA